jgi:hypothetical protein
VKGNLMPAICELTHEEFIRVWNSPAFTSSEKKLLEFLFRRNSCSGFNLKFFELAFACDLHNLELLAKGFPNLIYAFKVYKQGYLIDRVEKILDAPDTLKEL